MSFRSRAGTILAGGLLAVAFTGAPSLAAEPSPDDPVATVNTLIDTLLAKDFAGIGPLVCAEKREAALAELDLAGAMGALPPGMDGQVLLDALLLSAPSRVVTLLSNDGATAVVDVAVTLGITLEEEGAKALIVGILESQGMEPTDELIAMALPMLIAELGQMTQEITDQVDVIVEDGAWLLCDDLSLGSGPDASPVPSALPAASASPAA